MAETNWNPINPDKNVASVALAKRSESAKQKSTDSISPDEVGK